MTLDELRNDVHAWLAEPKARDELPTWRADAVDDAGVAPWPMLMVNAVGGSTLHYPGLSARFQPWNFAARSATRRALRRGRVPADSTLADWPLGYDELEPFYDAVEHAIGVAGQAGNRRGALDRRQRVRGRAGRGYPLPPLRRTGWTELTADAARALGWHPFPAPDGDQLRALQRQSGMHLLRLLLGERLLPRRQRLDRRERHPPGRGDRAAAHRDRRARDAHRVDRDGLVTGATYVQDGREHFRPARVVLLATFTYENTRLLLLSRSPAYPRGLANAPDQVGRHYMAHVTPFVFGRFPGRRLNLFNGLWAQATCVDDWNADNFDHTGLGFVGGGLLAASHEFKPIAFAGFPLPPGVPRLGSGWKAWLAANAQSVGSADRPDGVPALRGQPARSRSGGARSARACRSSASRYRVHENELRGAASSWPSAWRQWLAPRGRREVVARAAAVRRGAPLLRRYADGRRSRELGRRSLRLRASAPNLGVHRGVDVSVRRAATTRRSRCRRSRGARRSIWSSAGTPSRRPDVDMKSDIFRAAVPGIPRTGPSRSRPTGARRPAMVTREEMDERV